MLKEYKRRGIGKKLIENVFNQYEDVRQKLLLTDNMPETVGFYEALGFTNAAKYNMVSFVK